MPDEVPATPDLSPEVVAAAMEKAKDLNLNVPPDPFIIKVVSYQNEMDIIVDHAEVIEGKLPKDAPEYMAKCLLVLGDPKNPFKKMISSPVTATSLQEAFKNAPAALDVAIKEWMTEMENKAKARIAKESLRKKLTTGLHQPLPPNAQ